MSDPASHAQDSTAFEFPQILGGEVHLPKIPLGSYELQLTKYMVIEVFVAIALLTAFIYVARCLKAGGPPKGRFLNLFETLLVYIRDNVARTAIDKHHADAYLPFLWTVFFFILFCNLFGMLPWMGSPTGSIGTTGFLALTSFLVVVGTGIKAHGPIGFWIGLVPRMEFPFLLSITLKPILVAMLFVIEVVSLFIKHGVLAIRLWANMFAGHVVLAVFLSFIAAAADSTFFVWGGVTVLSIAMSLAISMLELLVAFLQAYIFTFLTALFIGGAIHQH